jgi:hypothetical protein
MVIEDVFALEVCSHKAQRAAFITTSITVAFSEHVIHVGQLDDPRKISSEEETVGQILSDTEAPEGITP